MHPESVCLMNNLINCKKTCSSWHVMILFQELDEMTLKARVYTSDSNFWSSILLLGANQGHR